MTAERIDVLAIYDVAIFQRRRRLRQMTDKAWPQRAIERQEAHVAAAIEARAAVGELLSALEHIASLARALRKNGPAPEDLDDLSNALIDATDTAHIALARVGAP